MSKKSGAESAEEQKKKASTTRGQRNQKAGWSSKGAFIVALIASAVGLGNIWRFPYLLKEFGGNFFIVYVVLAFVMGTPLVVLEMKLAERYKEPMKKLFDRYLPVKNVYLLSVALIFVIASYYSVVTAQTLTYTFEANPQNANLGVWLVVWFIALYALTKGIKGIEEANKFFMGLLTLLLIYLFIRVVDIHKLPALWTFTSNKPLWQIVVVAISQVLFSLSVGAGMTYTYSEYMKKHFSPWKIAGIVVLADTSIAVISAFIVYSLPAGGAGVFTAFSAMKEGFWEIGGAPLSVVFFLSLFSAAITSLIAELKLIRDDAGKTVAYLSVAASFFVWLGGAKAIRFLDVDIVGNFFLPLLLINLGIFIYLLKRESTHEQKTEKDKELSKSKIRAKRRSRK